jgi:PAS domain-containing protein
MTDKRSLIDQLNQADVRGDFTPHASPFGEGPTAGLGLEEILDALPFYVMIVDARHRVLFANRMISDLVGHERPIVGEYCPRAVHGLDGPFPGCPLETAVETNQAVERELFDERSGRWFNSAIYPTACSSAEGHTLYLHFIRDITAQRQVAEERQRLSERLEDALARVLQGFIPICAGCKQIRAEDGTWQSVESYVEERSSAQFSHSLCDRCAEQLYGSLDDD